MTHMAYEKREEYKCKILAVDDTPANLRLLIELFDPKAYTVFPARNASIALARLQSDLPDVILLDINMPEMNGFELCRAIRKDPRTQDIPILFISGRNDTEAVAQGFAAGGVDFITKPFRTDEVLARVNAHLMLGQYRNQLKRQNEALQEEVRIRQEKELEITLKNQELDASLRELKQAQSNLIHQAKMVGIGQLAGGVAHEINNPLGFVVSNGSVLQTYLETIQTLINDIVETINGESAENARNVIKTLIESPRLAPMLDDAQELLQESCQGLNRIRRIVSSLLAFSGEYTPGEIGPCNIDEVVETVLTVSAGLSESMDISVQNNAGSEFMASKVQIEQALMNILMNAYQAVRDDRRFKGNADGRIDISTFSSDTYVGCSIRDNGVPIAPEARERIFEPFFTTRPVGEGTGLGLSAAYDIIVNKHHGKLYFEETPEREKTFTFMVPIEPVSS